MSGRDWLEALRNAVPWIVFLVALITFIVWAVAWSMGGWE